jgi:hypothetical protein
MPLLPRMHLPGTWVNKGKEKAEAAKSPGPEGLPYGNGLGFFVG